MTELYKKTTLDNGLRIIAHEMSGKKSLGLGIWINIGGRYESSKNKGISHFLEHLLFKGTKKYSCRKIKESIEGRGGVLNGFTSEELTCYLVKVPQQYLEEALDVLSDMVINPALLENEIEKEKTVILEEIKMYKDLPQSYVHELLDELLWPNQALGSPIIGTVESVSKTSKNDLDLFKRKYYTPSNIVISAAGNLDYERLKKAATRLFSSLKKINTNTFSLVQEKQHTAQFKALHKDTEQTHLALGFHSIKREHPLKHALGILHIILGANMSSRLFNEIREKRGLAYEIGTAVKRFQDTGSFIVHAGIDNCKVIETIKLISQELEKAKDALVTKDEFLRAKEFYIGQLMLSLEDTLDHMLWIGETTAILNKTYSFENIIDEVNSVKREDVRCVAQGVFKKEKLNLSLIGPIKPIEEKIRKEIGACL
ncbi:MAG: pitrilysin family protein [Candidatus Omnitrophota bacterium]|nr:pitrilysin family protein [Candidatus Omnitrophota bacterium]